MLQRELEVLSVQHSQKCLENSQLNQQLQEQQQALKQCQNHIQELKMKQVSFLYFSRHKDVSFQMHLCYVNLSLMFKRDETSEEQLPNGKPLHVSPHTADRYETEVGLKACGLYNMWNTVTLHI